MKFAATINLAGIDDAGLSNKTDLADWVIIEYIADWYSAPKATKRADKVWINYKHLMAQVPILGIKSKSAVSARLHKLAELGLLVVEQDDDGRLFASLGQVAIDVRCFRVDRSPGREGVLENERGVRENEHTIENHDYEDLVPTVHSHFAAPKRPAVPVQAIIDLYHQILPFGSACRKLTAKRKAAISARWRSGDLPDLETWREYFERAAKSKFIRGEVAPTVGHRQFQVSLDYLIREDSYAKALENTGAFKW